MLRIGIFGGSFDPVHNGHLALATAALETELIDRLEFTPTCKSPFKAGQKSASAVHRLAMLECAIQGKSCLGICREEIDRGGVSYTFDLLSGLIEAAPPGVEYIFVIGADSLATLHKWYKANELVKLCRIISFGRPNTPIVPTELGFDTLTNKRLFRDYFPNLNVSVSSSAVRSLLAQGKSIANLVPAAVEEYIRLHKVY